MTDDLPASGAPTPPPAPAGPTDPLADLRRRPYVYRPPLAPQKLADVSPSAPSPEPSDRRPRQSVFFALLAVVTLACSAGGFLLGHARNAPAAAAPANSTGTASAAPAPSPPPFDAADGTALLAQVVPVPHGAKKVDIGGAAGVFDLGDYADRDFPDDPAESARMRARQFEWMAERGWVTTKGVEYHVQLVEFASPDGAQSMLRSREYSVGEADTTWTTFTVDGVDGAKGYERKNTDPSGRHGAVVYASQGNLVVVIFVYVKGSVDESAVSALMRTQVARLPG